MSVVFIIGSEEQLSSGIGWAQVIARTSAATIQAVVIGTEHKALLHHTKQVLSDRLEMPIDQVSATAIDADPDALLSHLKTVRCSALAMVHGTEIDQLQRVLFERCRAPAFWLQPCGQPPAAPSRMFAVLQKTKLVTATAAEKLFGFAPAAVLADPQLEENESAGEYAEKLMTQIESEIHQDGDLVLIGIDDPTRGDVSYTVALKMLQKHGNVSLALVHDGDSLTESLGSQIQDWFASVAPPMSREQRIELAADLEAGSQPNLEFLGLISAAAMLAAFGLLQNSAAVIIGAMLIAPLMTPIIGAGLALTHGNQPLFRSALATILLGFVGALFSAMLFGFLVRFSESYLHVDLIADLDKLTEMRSRCRPSPIDMCVGLVGGIAASYSRTRKHLSSALAGAAIAAALVPPIATAGLQLSFGVWTLPGNVWPITGPLLLVSVNVLTIMIGSSWVLWARGMRADRKLPAKARWAPRMVVLLLLLACGALIWMLPVV